MSEPFLPQCSKQAGVVLSGIGGWEIGLTAAGWDIAYSAENDPGKIEVLRRNFNHSVTSWMPKSHIENGLFVIGGLPEHSCMGQLWDNCMQALAASRARWVILETVHTVMREKVWPGSIGRIQKDLYDAGYTTLWFVVLYGCKDPVIRWTRLIVIGYPMGCGIPVQLSQCHGQAVLMNDIEMSVNVQCGQTYPRHSLSAWMEQIGFPETWLSDREPKEDYLTVATLPAVAMNIGRMILSADQYMTQLIEQEDGAHAL